MFRFQLLHVFLSAVNLTGRIKFFVLDIEETLVDAGLALNSDYSHLLTSPADITC